MARESKFFSLEMRAKLRDTAKFLYKTKNCQKCLMLDRLATLMKTAIQRLLDECWITVGSFGRASLKEVVIV